MNTNTNDWRIMQQYEYCRFKEEASYGLFLDDNDSEDIEDDEALSRTIHVDFGIHAPEYTQFRKRQELEVVPRKRKSRI